VTLDDPWPGAPAHRRSSGPGRRAIVQLTVALCRPGQPETHGMAEPGRKYQ